MRWTWPSWAAIVLGLAAVIFGFAAHNMADQAGALVSPLLIGGMILLALGLSSLQRSYDACSDWCDYDDCDCNHCAGCKRGDCCGKCECYDDDDGHKGHKH